MSFEASLPSTALPLWTRPDYEIMPPTGQPSKTSSTKPVSSEKANDAGRRLPLAATAETGSGKRLACVKCRERKIRCNREQPICGRCARLGHNCKYTAPAKQNSSQMDISQLLLTLSSRLAHTEARLAMNSPVLDANQGMNCDVEIPPLEFKDMQQQVGPPDMGYLDNLNMNEQIMQSDIDTWSVCEGAIFA